MRLEIGSMFTGAFFVAVENQSAEIGLCADCEHMRRVVSDRGSPFYLCAKALNDPEFRKYPRLPVASCRGYAKKVKSESDHQSSH
jgi:hypothetical protein